MIRGPPWTTVDQGVNTYGRGFTAKPINAEAAGTRSPIAGVVGRDSVEFRNQGVEMACGKGPGEVSDGTCPGTPIGADDCDGYDRVGGRRLTRDPGARGRSGLPARLRGTSANGTRRTTWRSSHR